MRALAAEATSVVADKTFATARLTSTEKPIAGQETWSSGSAESGARFP
jgi:hypothetical protein